MAGSFNFSNQLTAAPATLVSAIAPTDTVIQVTTSVNFPAKYPFEITLQDSPVTNPEIVLVTSSAGANSFNVTRAQGQTAAIAHGAGAVAVHTLTAEALAGASASYGTGSGASTPTVWPAGQKVMGVNATQAGSFIIDPTQMTVGATYTMKDEALNADSFPSTLTVASGTIVAGSASASAILGVRGGAISFYSNGTNIYITG